ncbi:MAG TPA: hypothetical protein VM389_03865 [Phycisphaerae bacterium]|nr:hypothetical protein [Phycisphaerae bacterium]HUU21651.1 hypothetical protein [Phycisphaerae bacterium]
MRYRVHYVVRSERRTAEVEAASPQEAEVKFRHTCADCDMSKERDSQVLSICPDPDVYGAGW